MEIMIYPIMYIHVLTISDVFRKLFVDVRFSEQGSNAREKEESVYMMFLDYLKECEQGLITISTPSHLLAFV